MAVKESITLEGADQVKKAWQDVGAAGENALSQLRSAGANFGNVIVKFGSDTERATGSVQRHSGAIGGLRNALHVLGPIVRQTGTSVGELGAFSKVAQAGLLGLAAAITGTVLVALSKMADSSGVAKNRLEELLQSKDLGAKAFDNLDSGAKKLGTSTSNLIPIFEAARTAIQSIGGNRGFVGVLPPGLAGNVDDISKSIIDLFAVVRRSVGDSQKASQALITFFDAVKRDGAVTRDTLEQLRKTSPGAVNIIAEAFSLGKVSVDDWLKSISPAGLKLDDVFRKVQLLKTINPQAFQTQPVSAFGTALEALGRRVDDIVKLFTGGDTNKLAASFVTAFTNGLTIIANVILALKNNIIQVFQSISAGAQAVWESIKATFSVNPFAEIARAFSDMFDDFVRKAQDVWNRIKQIFSEPLNVITNFVSGAGGTEFVTPGGEGIPGGSTGGLFRGKPGIDTNLAWLTSLEYVMRPEAVRRYGVNFMHMINSLKFPGFSMGGLVEGLGRPAIPAFAAGGLNISHSISDRDLTKLPPIVFGNASLRGLLAPRDVADALLRDGRNTNRANAGRAPSRVGRR